MTVLNQMLQYLAHLKADMDMLLRSLGLDPAIERRYGVPPMRLERATWFAARTAGFEVFMSFVYPVDGVYIFGVLGVQVKGKLFLAGIAAQNREG